MAEKAQADLREVYASPTPVLGAPIIGAEVGDVAVVENGVVVDRTLDNYDDVITPTEDN